MILRVVFYFLAVLLDFLVADFLGDLALKIPDVLFLPARLALAETSFPLALIINRPRDFSATSCLHSLRVGVDILVMEKLV